MEFENRSNFDQIVERVNKGEIIRLTQPLDGLTHPMTRPNERGGFVSLENLTKSQIMEIYQLRASRIENEAV